MERLPEFIANHLFLFMLLISILMLLAWNIFGSNLNGVPLIQPAEVTRLINQQDAVVLDVRKESQYEAGHIINSMNIPQEHLAGQLNKLKPYKDKGVIVYCDTGAISGKQARKLLDEGYEKIYCLKGGMPTWKNAGLPIAKGKK